MRRKYWIIFSIIVVVMIVGGLIGRTTAYYRDTELAYGNSLTTRTDWYDLHWKWRKQIRISNSGSAVSNLAFKINLTYFTSATDSMKTNFSDIRFTSSDGITLLNYYLEYINTTASPDIATIWVKIPSIATNAGYSGVPTQNIYMYYGNADATNAGSGANTFLWFEDFSSGALNTSNNALNNYCTILQPTRGSYEIVSPPTAPSPATPVATSGYPGTKYLRLRNTSLTSSGFGLQVNLLSTLSTPCTVEFWAQPAQTNALWELQGLDNSSRIGPRMNFNSSSKIQYYNGVGTSNAINPYSTSNWYLFSMDNVNYSAHTYQPWITVNPINGGTATSYGTNPAFNNSSSNLLKYVKFFDSTNGAKTLFMGTIKVRDYYSASVITWAMQGEE